MRIGINRMTKRKVNANAVSLAGEFATLSQLALRGYDANMTLGQTKGVDILVSDPESDRMFRIEVKTSGYRSRKGVASTGLVSSATALRG